MVRIRHMEAPTKTLSPYFLRPGISRDGNVIYLDFQIARRIGCSRSRAGVSEFAEAGHVNIPANAQTSALKNVRIVTPTEKLFGFRTVTEARHKMANAIAADPIPLPPGPHGLIHIGVALEKVMASLVHRSCPSIDSDSGSRHDVFGCADQPTLGPPLSNDAFAPSCPQSGSRQRMRPLASAGSTRTEPQNGQTGVITRTPPE